jgi:hypothetical protein
MLVISGNDEMEWQNEFSMVCATVHVPQLSVKQLHACVKHSGISKMNQEIHLCNIIHKKAVRITLIFIKHHLTMNATKPYLQIC